MHEKTQLIDKKLKKNLYVGYYYLIIINIIWGFEGQKMLIYWNKSKIITNKYLVLKYLYSI